MAARQRWRAVIAAQEASGLGVAEFCRRQPVPRTQFFGWRRRLREEAVICPLLLVQGYVLTCPQISFTGGAAGNPAGGLFNVAVTYAPDGDVAASSDWVNGDWTYQYDDLNRLAGANCAANCPGGQAQLDLVWGYDRFGNRWTQSTTAGAAPAPSATFWGTNGVSDNRERLTNRVLTAGSGAV